MSGRLTPSFSGRATSAVDDLLNRVIDKTVKSGFDPDFYAAMSGRDDRLIEDEILNGAGSSIYVYSFDIGGKVVSGISVIGARELAHKHGKLHMKIVSTVYKDGKMMVVETFDPVFDLQIREHDGLAALVDDYKIHVTLTDMAVQNTFPFEHSEAIREERGKRWLANNPNASPEDRFYPKPHYKVVAQSKVFRRAVTSMIPQHVIIEWRAAMLKLEKGDVLTDDVLGLKRDGVIAYATKRGIAIDHDAVERLGMAQIAGLSDAAREGQADQFALAAQALGITMMVGNPDGTKGAVVVNRTAPKQAQASGGTATGGAGSSTGTAGAVGGASSTAPTGGAVGGSGGGGEQQKQEVKKEAPPAEAQDPRDEAEAKKETQEQAPMEFAAVDELGEAVLDPANQPVVFTDPVLFARWLRNDMDDSKNPGAVWENNADNRELAMAHPEAAAILEGIVLPEYKITGNEEQELPAQQDPPQEQTGMPVAPSKIQLRNRPDGVPDWPIYESDMLVELGELPTEAHLDAWVALNKPTYVGKAYNWKWDAHVDKTRARLRAVVTEPPQEEKVQTPPAELTAKAGDIENLRAGDYITEFEGATTQGALNSITDRATFKTWAVRMRKADRSDVMPLVDAAYKAAAERINPKKKD